MCKTEKGRVCYNSTADQDSSVQALRRSESGLPRGKHPLPVTRQLWGWTLWTAHASFERNREQVTDHSSAAGWGCTSRRPPEINCCRLRWSKGNGHLMWVKLKMRKLQLCLPKESKWDQMTECVWNTPCSRCSCEPGVCGLEAWDYSPSLCSKRKLWLK